ncbi:MULTISPECIES: hypothetical protein [Pseudomonas]
MHERADQAKKQRKEESQSRSKARQLPRNDNTEAS